jgi:hypothetical protein
MKPPQREFRRRPRLALAYLAASAAGALLLCGSVLGLPGEPLGMLQLLIVVLEFAIFVSVSVVVWGYSHRRPPALWGMALYGALCSLGGWLLLWIFGATAGHRMDLEAGVLAIAFVSAGAVAGAVFHLIGVRPGPAPADLG